MGIKNFLESRLKNEVIKGLTVKISQEKDERLKECYKKMIEAIRHDSDEEYKVWMENFNLRQAEIIKEARDKILGKPKQE